MQQTAGAVGYVEQAYALQHNFTYASVKNKAGKFVAPSLASTSAAAAEVAVPANLGIKISNPGGAGSYPITSQTFIVVNKDLCKAGVSKTDAKNVVGFLDYALGPGQDTEAKLSYAKDPPNILGPAQKAASGLECNGSPVS